MLQTERDGVMSDVDCKPNFFIVGAPKSGTTSLHNYLSQHPDVFMSVRKEPCFLAPDFSSPAYPQTEEEYLRCFRGYNGEIRVGESTTSYLYSRLAARRIRDFAPNARIIAMLRHPVDMIISLHTQYCKIGIENISRFEDALEAESDRRQGKRIPNGFRYPKEYLLYREVGKYAKQLERYFCEFGRENVHVIIFDDFRQDTEGEFTKVCEFLGVSTDFKPNFTIKNPAQTPRSLMLHRVAFRIKFIEKAIVRWLRPIIPSRLGKVLWRIYRIPWKLNMKTGRAPISSETRMTLFAYYEQEIKDLERLLRADLSCWRITEECASVAE